MTRPRLCGQCAGLDRGLRCVLAGEQACASRGAGMKALLLQDGSGDRAGDLIAGHPLYVGRQESPAAELGALGRRLVQEDTWLCPVGSSSAGEAGASAGFLSSQRATRSSVACPSRSTRPR